MMEHGLFQEDDQHHAQECKQRCQCTHIQRNEVAGDGGADIGAHDDPYCLPQGHHTGVDEAHYHDRGGGGGLDDSGDAGTYQYAQNPVGGEFFQNLLHTVARGGLQTIAHHLHAVQEQRQTAKKAQQVTNSHGKTSLS